MPLLRHLDLPKASVVCQLSYRRSLIKWPRMILWADKTSAAAAAAADKPCFVSDASLCAPRLGGWMPRSIHFCPRSSGFGLCFFAISPYQIIHSYGGSSVGQTAN